MYGILIFRFLASRCQIGLPESKMNNNDQDYINIHYDSCDGTFLLLYTEVVLYVLCFNCCEIKETNYSN
jgi:hypothetical protein